MQNMRFIGIAKTQYQELDIYYSKGNETHPQMRLPAKKGYWMFVDLQGQWIGRSKKEAAANLRGLQARPDSFLARYLEGGK